ncbi:MAG TPA: DUF4340 domain-containing protein [Kofleriaceae bacterium]
MKSALIHGILLAVMLVYGYRTWTRDKTVQKNLGSVVLWDKSEADLVSIVYSTDKVDDKLPGKPHKLKTVRIERRGDGSGAYWWGIETTVEKKEKPPEPPKPDPAAGSGSAGSGSAGSGSAGSGSAGSGSAGSAVAAGSGSAGSGSAAPTAKPTIEEKTKKREFPLSDNGQKVVTSFYKARAMRDLGILDDKAKQDYKLADTKNTLEVTFRDGKRTFALGGDVYGDRYILDSSTGRGYVLSKELVSALEVGESSLQLTEPKGFEATKIDSVVIESGGRTKNAKRIETEKDGKKVKTWGDAATAKADSTLGTFIDNANNLRPTEYAPDLKVEALTPVVRLSYRDATGGALGTLTLFRREKAGVLPEGQELDPANPPKGETEYYILTERTHVPALVLKDNAERTEGDVPIVFGDKPAPVKSIDPKGNPFGNQPLPKPDPKPPGGGSAAAPPGGLPGMGSAAPGGPTGPGASPFPGAGSAEKPAAGSAAKPGTGSAAKPAGGAAKPGAGSAAKPAGGAAKPGAGSAAKPAAGSAKPAGSAAHDGHAH